MTSGRVRLLSSATVTFVYVRVVHSKNFRPNAKLGFVYPTASKGNKIWELARKRVLRVGVGCG